MIRRHRSFSSHLDNEKRMIIIFFLIKEHEDKSNKAFVFKGILQDAEVVMRRASPEGTKITQMF